MSCMSETRALEPGSSPMPWDKLTYVHQLWEALESGAKPQGTAPTEALRAETEPHRIPREREPQGSRLYFWKPFGLAKRRGNS